MEKSKKKEGLARLFEIAGQKKGLLVMAGVLSACWQCGVYARALLGSL